LPTDPALAPAAAPEPGRRKVTRVGVASRRQ
jgi:hypothetical protein